MTNRNAAMTISAPPSVPERHVPELKLIRVTFRGALLFVTAIAILMGFVYSRMELSRINSEYHIAVLELQRLKQEEGVLIRRAEASLSLSEVEAYAIGELGMVQPSREQFVYVGSPAYDHAEIIRHESIFGRARRLFSTVGIHIIELLD
jgi:cell division protein FtsL